LANAVLRIQPESASSRKSLKHIARQLLGFFNFDPLRHFAVWRIPRDAFVRAALRNIIQKVAGFWDQIMCQNAQ
jgi:hypothetical protein